MKIRKLDQTFFAENEHLQEVLDKRGHDWDTQKVRGYGVVVIDYNALKFGIPFRSRIAHHACYKTSGSKGLDFSKSVLLHKSQYISSETFRIPQDEFDKIRSKSFHIRKKFNSYVEKYVRAVRNNDARVLSMQYRYSTLMNYHKELGC